MVLKKIWVAYLDTFAMSLLPDMSQVGAMLSSASSRPVTCIRIDHCAGTCSNSKDADMLKGGWDMLFITTSLLHPKPTSVFGQQVTITHLHCIDEPCARTWNQNRHSKTRVTMMGDNTTMRDTLRVFNTRVTIDYSKSWDKSHYNSGCSTLTRFLSIPFTMRAAFSS